MHLNNENNCFSCDAECMYGGGVCMFSAKIVVCCYNVGGVGANVILHLVMSTWIIATL